MADDNLMGKLGKSVSGIQTEEEQSQQDQVIWDFLDLNMVKIGVMFM